MTSTGRPAPASRRTRISLACRIAGWIGTRQQAISDHVHANGDAYAVAHGWTVTASSGRFGFGARAYRDPRFDSPRHQDRPAGPAWPGEFPGSASAPRCAAPIRPGRTAR